MLKTSALVYVALVKLQIHLIKYVTAPHDIYY